MQTMAITRLPPIYYTKDTCAASNNYANFYSKTIPTQPFSNLRRKSFENLAHQAVVTMVTGQERWRCLLATESRDDVGCIASHLFHVVVGEDSLFIANTSYPPSRGIFPNEFDLFVFIETQFIRVLGFVCVDGSDHRLSLHLDRWTWTWSLSIQSGTLLSCFSWVESGHSMRWRGSSWSPGSRRCSPW
jgi:hypothetical protein